MQRLNFQAGGFGMMPWTPVVKILILSNVTIYAMQVLLRLDWPFIQLLGLWPQALLEGKLWQLFTYMFLHGGIGHIFFNMLALWMFGSVLENYWGSREFIKYYLLTGIGGGVSYALFNLGSNIPTVGASGAIYGLLTAYAVMFPNAVIYVWGIIPMRAKWFALLFGAIEFFASFKAGSSVAHLAHLGGMVIGYIYLKRGRITGGGSRLRKWQAAIDEGKREREAEDLNRIRREVDELLDKINRVGMDGLTKDEQRRLEKASKILRERENR